MILQFVHLKTGLSDEEMTKRALERKPQFEAIPGLIQKYYVKKDKPGEYGGVYVWDSMESIKAFRESELAATIPEAYMVLNAPKVELMEILFPLREL